MSLNTPVWKRSWPFLILTVCFVLGTTYLRVFWKSRQNFVHAEILLQQGQLEAAIRQYGRTVRWYIPGNRYTAVAAERLFKISELTYQQGKWEQAIMALQHLHNALSAIRSWYQPYASILSKTQLQLAESLSLVNHRKDHTSRLQARQKLLQMQQHNPSPPIGRTLLASVAYLLWLGSMAALLWFWHTLSRQNQVRLIVLHLGLMMLWMWGLLA